MKLLSAACLLTIALSVHGCGVPAAQSAWTTEDSWYRPATAFPTNGVAHTLTDKEFHKIDSLKLPKAEAMLKVKPIVELSAAQAKAFLGSDSSVVAGKRPFLVRAVYLNEGTGGFGVSQQDKRLWVDHGCLGSRAVPMKRQALVVFLKSRPTQIFVQCSMAR